MKNVVLVKSLYRNSEEYLTKEINSLIVGIGTLNILDITSALS